MVIWNENKTQIILLSEVIVFAKETMQLEDKTQKITKTIIIRTNSYMSLTTYMQLCACVCVCVCVCTHPSSDSSPSTAAPSTIHCASVVSGSFFCTETNTNTQTIDESAIAVAQRDAEGKL